MTRHQAFDLTPLLQVAAHDLQAAVTGDTRWACLGSAELDALTRSDRDLILVATGERLPAVLDGEEPVGFFALQLVADRLTGPLRDGDDVSIAYVEDLYTVYEDNPDGTPISGDTLDLCLAYLAGRELAVLGPDLS